MKAFEEQMQSSSPLSENQLSELSRTQDHFGNLYKVGDHVLYALVHEHEDELEIVTVVAESYPILEEKFTYVGPSRPESAMPRFVTKELEHLYGYSKR